MFSSSSSRRRFLQQTAAMGLVYSSRSSFAQSMQSMAQKAPNAPGMSAPMLHVLELPPFVDALPIPENWEHSAAHAGSDGRLRITMREIHHKVHRDLPPTRMWSYGPTALGPVIQARSGHPLQIEWINNLPTRHFLPIDHSLHGCGHDIPDVRAVTHVHGARVPSKDDGYPEDWFVPGKSRTCTYPLEQEAATLWYHDHAMGLNRLNSYAGLFGMFLIRDKVEDDLHLPTGKYEVPLILYDRDFTTDGQLYYPSSGDPEHPWVPEFNADGILINGKIRPYFEVEPRLYRFRVVNVANSRFFNLSLSNGRPFVQIGGDQGLLPAPVEMKRLMLAPAERADLLLDLTQSAGQTVHLRTGGLDILELRVAVSSTSPARQAYSIPTSLRAIPRTPESAATVTRTITLHEYQNQHGQSMMMLLNRKHWHEPTTEFPKLNSTEIWEFVNLTEDVHPMHLHLVRFQILDRRPFDMNVYLRTKKFHFTAEVSPPDANELGWKDTVQCPDSVITRVIVRFEGYPGKYLYHCHILEHEANDMMRPFEVVV